MEGDILAVQIWRTLRLIVSHNTFRIQITLLVYISVCLFCFPIVLLLTKQISIRLQAVMVQLAGCLGQSVILSFPTHLQLQLCLWEPEITSPFHLDGQVANNVLIKQISFMLLCCSCSTQKEKWKLFIFFFQFSSLMKDRIKKMIYQQSMLMHH